MQREHAILLVILLFAVFLRFLPLGSQAQFYEPDNYIYFSMAQQTIANNMSVPATDALSGFPVHNKYTESPYLVLVPAFISLFGIPLADSFHLISLAAGLAGIILAYLFAKKLTDSNTIPLLAAFFLATLFPFVFKTSWLEYRGETIVPVLLAASIYLLCSSQTENAISKPRIFFSAILLIAGVLMWNGGIYALVCFGFAAIGMLLKNKIEMKKLALLLAAIAAISWIAFTQTTYARVFLTTNPLAISEVGPPSLLSLAAQYYLALPLLPIGLIWLILNAKPERRQWILGLYGILLPTLFIMSTQARWSVLPAIPMAIFAAFGIEALYDFASKGMLPYNTARNIALMAILLAIMLPIYQFQSAQPADSQNQYFFQALAFLHNSTPKNATVLSIWDDGSLIEGAANRTAYTDSVPGLGGDTDFAFERFMAENSLNLTYLQQVKPDYLFIRTQYLVFENPFPISNNSNIKMLLQPKNMSSQGVSLSPVFHNPQVTIYKVNLSSQTIIQNNTLQINKSSSNPSSPFAYLQFITNENYTLTIKGQISPITLSNKQIAYLPKGTYIINSTSDAYSIEGDAVIKLSNYEDILILNGDAVIYLNSSS